MCGMLKINKTQNAATLQRQKGQPGRAAGAAGALVSRSRAHSVVAPALALALA